MLLADVAMDLKRTAIQNHYADLGYTPKLDQHLLTEAVLAGKRVLGHFTPPQHGKSYSIAKLAGAFWVFPDTRIWIIAPCVDVETEILTQRGWLTVETVQEGDIALTLNTDGNAEWQQIEKLHVSPWSGDLIHIQYRGHDSLTTPHHRWLVGWTSATGPNGNGKRRLSGYRFTRTDALSKPNEFFLGAAPVLNLPTHAVYSDALVELVAWYWTEGHDNTSADGICICQNAGENTERIRRALTAHFGPPSKDMRSWKREPPAWHDWKHTTTGPSGTPCGIFSLNSTAGVLIKKCAPDKVVSPGFLSSLTSEQVNLFVQVSLLGDGSERQRDGRRERILLQARKDRIDSFQMACQLAGIQTRLKPDTQHGWTLSLYERTRSWPGQKGKLHRPTRYDGIVWCPQTKNGTWLARRNGTVYFTGNTYVDGELPSPAIMYCSHIR